MILKSERLILRPWEDSDAESLFEYAKDPEIGPVAGWPAHGSLEESRYVIAHYLNSPECYAICLKGQNSPIGAIELKLKDRSNMTKRDDECELGYWLGKPFWGCGIMPEAARELIRHGFVDLHMKTIWCGYYDGNEKSRRVQEKCGFAYHHTCPDVPVPLLDETRTEHTNILTKEDWKTGFTVRRLTESETPAALALAWEVFLSYEAPDYSPEGAEEFRHALHDESYLEGLEYFGAFDRDTLIGMLAIRKEACHICFFFVDGRYHRLGLGTRLFECMKADYAGKGFTLNSSPYGLPFYHSLGFVATDSEQTVNGIRFTPMVWKK